MISVSSVHHLRDALVNITKLDGPYAGASSSIENTVERILRVLSDPQFGAL